MNEWKKRRRRCVQNVIKTLSIASKFEKLAFPEAERHEASSEQGPTFNKSSRLSMFVGEIVTTRGHKKL